MTDAMGTDASALGAFVGSLAGLWPAEPSAPQAACRPGNDLEGAVATWCDLPPTGEGPLSGLTLAVKDNIAVAGVPTALGSGLAGFVGSNDATIVARARAAGAHIVAKAQCEAFLLGANSFSSRPAPVGNPHDRARSAGGSSSGSAAMLAAGLADLAFGTDSGGSIRVPAAFCGVVGLKPTRGVVPCTGIAPLEPFLEHAGAMARSVREAAALFEAIRGADGIDPRCGWAPADTGISRPSMGKARIGLLAGALDSCDPPVDAGIRAALDRLREAGCRIEPFHWPAMVEARALHLAIYVTGQARVARAGFAPPGLAGTVPAGWVEWRRSLRPADLPPALLEALSAGDALDETDPGLHARAVTRALGLAAELDRQLAGYDALLLPVSPSLPPIIPSDPAVDDLYGDTSFTAPFNVTGHPALSLPCGMADGLPVGLQMVGHRGADSALLALAAAVERALAGAAVPTNQQSGA